MLIRSCVIAMTAIVFFTAACEKERSKLDSYPVIFQAKEPNGRPVGQVSVLINSGLTGTTDAQGRLRVSLQGKEGAQVKVQADCPEGFVDPVELQPFVLRKVLTFSANPEPQPIEFLIPCKPALIKAVVMVRTGGQADLPVLIDGREVGRTTSEGVAHVMVRMAPGTEFQVKLSTSHKPRLRPQEPSQTFSVPEVESVLVFDQAFEVVSSHRHSRKSHRFSRRKRTTGPVRLN